MDPNWFLVGLTAIYVAATIAICWANWASASAAKRQTEEMARQNKESRRTRLTVRFDKRAPKDRSIVLKNVGHEDALETRISVDQDFMDELGTLWPDNLLAIAEKSNIHIVEGQEFWVFVGFASTVDAMKNKVARITVHYNDLFGSYEETTSIDFSQYNFLSDMSRGCVVANGHFYSEGY